mmetsp:Transcript_9668/g.24580  ORF Transcript_9668/g.24580 Transcript_9668/m.24580 type:complete len:227 (+) Transcript_9668:1542-2222(+)
MDSARCSAQKATVPATTATAAPTAAETASSAVRLRLRERRCIASARRSASSCWPSMPASAKDRLLNLTAAPTRGRCTGRHGAARTAQSRKHARHKGPHTCSQVAHYQYNKHQDRGSSLFQGRDGTPEGMAPGWLRAAAARVFIQGLVIAGLILLRIFPILMVLLLRVRHEIWHIVIVTTAIIAAAVLQGRLILRGASRRRCNATGLANHVLHHLHHLQRFAILLWG